MQKLHLKREIRQLLAKDKKLKYANNYEYRKKMERLTANWDKLTEDESKAIKDIDYIKVSNNVKLKL